MAPAVGLVMIKDFTYRDQPLEQWSSKYWLTGTVPGTDTEWATLFNEFVALEQPFLPATTRIVGGYAYNDDTPGANSVWSIDLIALGQTHPGTYIPVGGHAMSGDQAACVEWKTSRKNTRGKWVYLRKYVHNGQCSSTDVDELSSEYLALLTTYANVLTNGYGAGARRLRSQKQAETIQLHGPLKYVTTRTLKRRGKRP